MDKDEEVKEVLKQIAEEEENTKVKKENKKEQTNTGCLIAFILIAIIIFLAFKGFQSFWNSLGSEQTNSGYTSSSSNNEPDDIELMSYAQTVLKDNLSNPKYSSNKSDYTFIKTNLRYKIEGKVTVNGVKENFYMIIKFIDDTYKEYDLVSLQVGNKKIY